MGASRMLTLKTKSTAWRPSGLEKLCKVNEVSSAERSMKSVVGEGDGHKMKDRTPTNETAIGGHA